MPITSNDILKALSEVRDPDLGKDLVTLNMVRDIALEPTRVFFRVVLTTPACPLKEKIRQDCIDAVRKVVGEAVGIQVKIDASVTSTRGGAESLREVKNIIAIASGKGGVGKSTVATNIAVALAQGGARVGLIDADIYGPSAPIMFNCMHEQPEMKRVNEKNFLVPLERYGVSLVSVGFLAGSDNAVIWRGPMASSLLKQFIHDVEWGALDYLLVDLPPGTGDIHLTLVQTLPVTGAIIVTTPQKVAVADARRSLAMFTQPRINVPVLGIVENMAYFTPEELPDHRYFIFGQGGGKQLAEQHNLPLLGQIPLVQGIRESADSGTPIALKGGIAGDAFVALAEAVAQQVAIRNAMMGQTVKVEAASA